MASLSWLSILLASFVLWTTATTGLAVAEYKLETVQTEDLNFDRKALAVHIATMVDGEDDFPFMKWQSSGEKPIKYFVLGLREPFLGAFHAVMQNLGSHVGLKFERSMATTGSQMLFFYVNELTDLLAIPNLARFFSGDGKEKQQAFRKLLTEEKPTINAGYGVTITDANSMVPSYFRLARALQGLKLPNEFVQAFAMDAYMALTLHAKPITSIPSSLFANLDDIANLAPKSPPYAWRIPPVDLLYLEALYQPSVASGLLDHEAATAINQIVREILASSRVLSPEMRFTP